MPNQPLEKVSARPVKSFFVHMLTRDIMLRDAILDLLDNCVDGIQRSATKKQLQRAKPYSGFRARITLGPNEFRIEDNCGGIPWEIHDYAFRLGKVSEAPTIGKRAIGSYGIGMKRAIFKLGEDCRIETHAKDSSYEIVLSADWMSSEDEWELEATPIKPSAIKGTLIVVRCLREGVQQQFASDEFLEEFRETLSTYYAYIMGMGFEVELNGKVIGPKQMKLLFAESNDEAFSKHRIQPFIYEAEHEGVSVFVAVGFSGKIPSDEEVADSLQNSRDSYSSRDAGWTVVCNDRTVVYCDRTSLTGWGVAGVPRYHTQFVAIAGIVLFTSEDPSRLPTTTTKRGIEASSDLYLQVRDKMIEGMQIFTRYTYAWKSKEEVRTSRKHFDKTTSSSLSEMRKRAAEMSLKKTKGTLGGRQHKPKLPKPVQVDGEKRITFSKPVAQIRRLSNYLFGDPGKSPKRVGEECFDLILKESEE